MEFKKITHPHYGSAYLYDYPNSCPICHNITTPNYKSSSFSDDLTSVSVFLICPNSSCEAGYVANYIMRENSYYYFNNIFNSKPRQEKFDDEIVKLSPFFVKIYNEAFFAEQHQLFEICGVGYRKALEFLIKDYLIHKNPDKEGDIKKLLLGKCINDFVDDNRIKQTSKRAVWLGNDHTHYVKKWEGKDLSDLKILLKLCVNWIESELLTEQFVISMSE